MSSSFPSRKSGEETLASTSDTPGNDSQRIRTSLGMVAA
eukprot:CAMPEP_0202843110 /NCGR_PEP_ID=MMETSP1389-20130828/63278_1 /ASSEMBLY_ACC=CAM_ASM_000865 /TAXON_ID=302021 /ORGANISM="Rhodomonas sp., Strain CCMP768" /LENGTH=38 /DNA_ID= /DNA_START= /DNA_END= /DNA_ORIENTATION=